MWKSDIEIFALTILPLLPLLLPKPPAFLTSLLPALLLSLIEFNSAQGDSVIDRLRETEEIWFKLLFFFTMHVLCQIFFFFFFYCALGFAIDSLLKTQPPPPSSFSSSLHTFPPH